MDNREIEEMQALPIPRATSEDVSFDALSEIENAEYVSHFLTPRASKQGEFMCAGCGADLTGLLTGTFTWGIQNGEGHCYRCYYPTRMYHRFKDSTTVSLPLQYHPDEMRKRNPDPQIELMDNLQRAAFKQALEEERL